MYSYTNSLWIPLSPSTAQYPKSLTSFWWSTTPRNWTSVRNSLWPYIGFRNRLESMLHRQINSRGLLLSVWFKNTDLSTRSHHSYTKLVWQPNIEDQNSLLTMLLVHFTSCQVPVLSSSSYSVYPAHRIDDQGLGRDRRWQPIPIKEDATKDSLVSRKTFR